jgi:alkylated DNA repair dioxygenase AlkB
MNQLSLFEPCETVLVDDARGQIRYLPRFIPYREAREWFDELRRVVEWTASTRMMYDREVDVPRLTASFRLEGDERPLPPLLAEAGRRVSAAMETPFTHVGLNRYRDGKDSVAPHNDHLSELVVGAPIVLLSLGATRRMTMRAKEPPRRPLHQDLEAGSLLVMSYDTQIHYTHGIPKTDDTVGERISLAFRVRPASPPGSVKGAEKPGRYE